MCNGLFFVEVLGDNRFFEILLKLVVCENGLAT